jgi:hypothetical protein
MTQNNELKAPNVERVRTHLPASDEAVLLGFYAVGMCHVRIQNTNNYYTKCILISL